MTTTDDPTKLLRLVAFDADDLAVISANLQDAHVAVPELVFLPKDRRFALVCKRFDCVRGVTRSGFDQTDAERVLNLLAIAFSPDVAPAGTVVLTFSGGAAIKLDVECIEAQMHDLGPRWPCRHQPSHTIEPAA